MKQSMNGRDASQRNKTARSVARHVCAAACTLALGVAAPAAASSTGQPPEPGQADAKTAAAARLAALAQPDATAAAEILELRRERRWTLLRRWLTGAPIPVEPTQTPAMSLESLRATGKRLYTMYCVNCHGPQGRGDGPRAPVLNPPPRDFTGGVFKFRSTPSGTPPTDEDLFRTISGGLRGTGMLPFADLPEEQRWALVTYVRALANDPWAQPGPDPLAIPEAPPDLGTRERVARGRAAYERLSCPQCHGQEGRGDGPSAATLLDARNRPIRPPDFAAQPFKRGDTPAALYRTLVTGLDGSPMPSYFEATTPDEVWDLVAFVESLQHEEARKVSPAALARARAQVVAQQRQGAHTVIGGCGCQARRKR